MNKNNDTICLTKYCGDNKNVCYKRGDLEPLVKIDSGVWAILELLLQFMLQMWYRYGAETKHNTSGDNILRTRLRSGFSIANQIKFDLRFTDLRSTWYSELIVDQLCFVFPWIFDLQLRDRRLADLPSTEPTLCQSDWLTVTLICDVELHYPACTASGRRSQ